VPSELDPFFVAVASDYQTLVIFVRAIQYAASFFSSVNRF
jgi:hypothetical protein